MLRRASARRIFILALDGVPFSLLQRAFEDGHCPVLEDLIRTGGTFRPIDSVIPPLSTVAWSSFITGKNPGKHGIFGFIDRHPNPLQTWIPTGRTLKSPTIFELLSDQGKSVITMNVPGTTPPRPIHGVWISGFMSLDLEKAVYPPSLASRLRKLGYRIDVNPWRAKEDPSQFLQDLHVTVDRRVETARWLMEEIPDWSLFMFHLMETDRFLHFYWDTQEDPDKSKIFWSFFDHVDEQIGKILSALPPHTLVVILSDHGFEGVRREVSLNTWLRDQGWLHFVQEPPKGLEDLDSRTKVYSLIPGRFYINLLGREAVGSVLPEEYEIWKKRITEQLLDLRDPENNAPVIHCVFQREDLYWGTYVSQAADLIALPNSGYELKGTLKTTPLFQFPTLPGSHSYDGAFLFFQGLDLPEDCKLTLYDVSVTVLDALGIPIPFDMDGHSFWRSIDGL